jgi:hypothetical protein
MPHTEALARGNMRCDNAPVPTPEYDPEIEAAALEEVAGLAAELEEAEAVADAKRDALHKAIAKHLLARNAPPGKIATSAKYDRNHVGRIAKAFGVPPLREPTVKSVRRVPRKKAG